MLTAAVEVCLVNFGPKKFFFLIFTVIAAVVAIVSPDLIFVLAFFGITIPLALYLALAPAAVLIGLIFCIAYFLAPIKGIAKVALAILITLVALITPPLLLNPPIYDQALQYTLADKQGSKKFSPGVRIALQEFPRYASVSAPTTCSSFCAELLASGLAREVAVYQTRSNRVDSAPSEYLLASAFVLKQEPICVPSKHNDDELTLGSYVFSTNFKLPKQCIEQKAFDFEKLDVLVIAPHEISSSSISENSKEGRKTAGTIFAKRMIVYEVDVDRGEANFTEVKRKTLVRYDVVAPIFLPTPVPIAKHYGLEIGPWPWREYLNTADNEVLSFDKMTLMGELFKASD